MSVDVKSNLYIDFGVENNHRDPKFSDGDHVKTSRYKDFD